MIIVRPMTAFFLFFFFFFNDTATTEIYTLSLHDALPIHDVPAAGSAYRVNNRCGAASNEQPRLRGRSSGVRRRSAGARCRGEVSWPPCERGHTGAGMH